MSEISLTVGNQIESDFCRQYEIPLLPLSPTERLQNLLAYRNDRRLYRRTCDATGESLISSYRPDCGFQVVKSEVWWGDSWDGLDYALNANPEQPFFPQFSAMQKRIPREGTSVVRAENCEYNSHTRDSKDCYLSHLAVKAEGVLFSYWTVGATDVLEGFYTTDCELCVRCSYVTKCYDCVHLAESANCRECYFSSELRNCSNCLFCTNLSGKQNYIRNRPCSKAEFQAEKQKYLSSDPQIYREACSIFESNLHQLRRAQHTLNSENCVGDHIQNSRDIFYGFDVLNSDRGFNVTNGGGNFIVHGYSVGFPECNHVFSSVTVRDSGQIFFSSNCWNSQGLWYCDNCVNCTDCFGCVGLKRRKFCIFNTEYSESEYRRIFALWREQMLARGEWGIFFPVQYSPYFYDESAAQDFFPLSRTEIESRGWKLTPPKETAAHETAGSAQKAGVVCCEECERGYRQVPRELALCSQFGVPLSPLCPDCRLTERLKNRSPYSLLQRNCSKCKQPTLTPLTKAHAKEIWCEACFVAEVF